MNEPFISIIVPAYNAQKTIKKCIESLLSIDYSNYEIFIINDGSIDKTKDISSEYKDRVKIIESQHVGPSACRNMAAKRSKGDFLAFTDADCLVDKNWLGELMRGFVSDKVVGVGGTQLSPQDETKFGKNIQAFFELTGFLGGYIKNKKDTEIIEVPHNPSCNVMYRKDVFLEIGAFDENLWPGEDVDLDVRLKRKGFVFMFNPKAIVYHYRPQSFLELSKMMYGYGVTQGILTKRYGFFRKIQFIPIISIFLLIFIILNESFLWLLSLSYLFILFKSKNLLTSVFVSAFIIFSAFLWNSGLLRGLIKEE